MTSPHPTARTAYADRPICENSDSAFLPTGTDPEPCSSECPKHGTVK